MCIDIASYTCSGGRSINEDSYFVGEQVFVVADGLGGHEKGEVASACAVESIKKNSVGRYSFDRINQILEAANQAVLGLNSQARTTVAAAFVDNMIFRYANVGDSRVYFFRDGKIIAQTKDHSVCQAEVEMGLLRPEDIRKSENRSRLLKALGSSPTLRLKKNYPQIKLKKGDAFLICSDGFWEYVYEDEMETDLSQSDSAENWISDMLKRHLSRSGDQGDNYTLICGRVDDLPDPAASHEKNIWGSVGDLFKRKIGGRRHDK